MRDFRLLEQLDFQRRKRFHQPRLMDVKAILEKEKMRGKIEATGRAL